MLADENPKLAAQWHPTLNNRLTPQSVPTGSRNKVWWKCDKNHEWQTTTHSRHTRNLGCPYCTNNKVLTGYNDLESHNPTLSEQWHPTRNFKQPRDVLVTSSLKAWWQCGKGHEWEALVHDRHKNMRGCPYCLGQRAIPGETDLATTHPELLRLWHPTLNTKIPQELMFGTGHKAWWKCEKGHEWQMLPSSVYRSKIGSCKECLEEERQSNPLLNERISALEATWHSTKKQPYHLGDIKNNLYVPAWWQCEKGHEWKQSARTRWNATKVRGCPYCGGRKVLFGFNDLKSQYPAVASEWHPTKNVKKPEDTHMGSHYRAWWVCDDNHEWQTMVYHRTVHNPTGCPSCSYLNSSNGEQTLISFIQEIYLEKVTLNTRKIIPPKEIDIYLPKLNIAIEFNGLYWHSDRIGKDNKYHTGKREACDEQGIVLIQIWEDDWNNKRDWCEAILKKILNREHIEEAIISKKIIQIDGINVEEIITDNMLNDDRWYVENGYSKVETLPPVLYYLQSNNRVLKPKKYTAPRIWDAGRSKWHKVVNNGTKKLNRR